MLSHLAKLAPRAAPKVAARRTVRAAPQGLARSAMRRAYTRTSFLVLDLALAPSSCSFQVCWS